MSAQVIPFPEGSSSLRPVRQLLSGRHGAAAADGARLYLATVRLGRHQCEWPFDAWANFSEYSTAPKPPGSPDGDAGGQYAALEYDVRTALLVLDAEFRVLEQLPLFARRRGDGGEIESGAQPPVEWRAYVRGR